MKFYVIYTILINDDCTSLRRNLIWLIVKYTAWHNECRLALSQKVIKSEIWSLYYILLRITHLFHHFDALQYVICSD